MQRWDREGRLKPERTPTGRRVYSKVILDAFMRREPAQSLRIPVAYCRVSSAAQKPDLKNQRRVLEDFCVVRGVANVEFIEEVGGGLFCAEHGTKILVLNNEQLSPEEEMVQDLLTIVHCFSARLYGLRNYRKRLNEALAEDLRA
jgi:putative resolvase